MSDASDMIKLYSKRILALSSDIPHSYRLDAPEASEMKRSPLCGSTVTVDVSIKNGLVSEFGQDVKACALGQAAASILGAAVVGQSLDSIRLGRDQLDAMLTADGPTPSKPFDELKVLEPAKAYKNRHASVLLAFDATVAALEALSGTA